MVHFQAYMIISHRCDAAFWMSLSYSKVRIWFLDKVTDDNQKPFINFADNLQP